MTVSNFILDNPEHWLQHAEEARSIAEELSDPESRRMILWIAEDYERLATDASRRKKAGWRKLKHTAAFQALALGAVRSHCAEASAPSRLRRGTLAISAWGLGVAASAEAADQESDAECDRGSRVGALLNGSAQEIAGLAAGVAQRFRRLRGGVPRLAVDVLDRPLELACLALELRLHVAGCPSDSFF
jgi:hypothetical protein